MLTIDRIAKIDSAALHIYGALQRVLGWLCDHYEARLVDAVYRVAEAKATAIGKAAAKISDLEDDRAELVAYGLEARTILQRKYREALEALTREQEAKDDKISAGLAAAAEELVAATKDYDATVREASEKLAIEVDA